MDQRTSLALSNIYLKRYAWQENHLPDYAIHSNSGMIVVIPAFNENNLTSALSSLNACHPPQQEVLVLVIVNEPQDAEEDIQAINRRSLDETKNFNAWFPIETIHLKLPPKKAGVGLARKIGMDEAVKIFEHSAKDGIIACFDADCTCDENYFLALEDFFEDPKNHLGLVYFEHPLNASFPSEIMRYELHLRYYIDALRIAGYPNAVQTLGSCITVRSRAYQKQGGMNTRKAGEDFYFIHKMVPLGGIGEITQTCIYPSDRTSNRVPFGTGHAINKYLQQPSSEHTTYHPATFLDLQALLSSYQQFYTDDIQSVFLPESITAFLQQTDFDKHLNQILKQSNNLENFRKRFFAWLDGFRTLKFVHFSRDHFHPDVSLHDATDWLISHLATNLVNRSLKDKLLLLREVDRKTGFYIR